MITKSAPSWYVLYTIPQHEKKIYESLQKRSVSAYLPLRVEYRTWSDRKKKVVVPLFPSYIFVNVSYHDRYKVLGIPGVIRFVSTNSQPARISDAEIDLIKKTEGGNVEVTEEKFEKGDVLRFTAGPLKDFIGVLVNSRGTKKLLFEISSLNKKLLLDFVPNTVMKVTSAKAV